MSGVIKSIKSKVQSVVPSSHPVKSITISKVTSFTEPESLALKKYNFIYGLNGSGKTTISRLLADQNREGYEDCNVTLSSPKKPLESLVYNEDYVKDTFYTEDKQKGIFTLDETNKKAIEAISEANQRKEVVTAEKKPLDEKLLALGQEQKLLEKKLIDEVYKFKKMYETTQSLKECMTGYLVPAKKFKDKVVSSNIHELEIEKIPDKINSIAVEYAELSDGSSTEKEIFSLLETGFSEFENNILFKEIIASSKDGYLSGLIDQLEHENWLNEGIDKYLDKTDDCPFCYRDLSIDLKDKIKSHIDTQYQFKIEQLKSLEKSYNLKAEDLLVILDSYDSSDILMSNKNLKEECKNLRIILESNNRKINSKISAPNTIVELISTENKITFINNTIAAINAEHIAFNNKLKDSKLFKDEIKNEFWCLIRKLADKTITDFNTAKEKNTFDQKPLIFKIKELEEVLKSEDAIIQKFQNETKNVDEAVIWIDKTLKLIGLSGFSFEKEVIDSITFYRLTRTDTGKNVFHSLSEGEKTLISFLYFVQSCMGVTDADTKVSIEDRVIVIDDPISSLSFNHVFDISCLIKKIFFSKDKVYGQVIVLTHHLYFLHEMFAQIERNTGNELGKKCATYRVIKGKRSIIEKINRSQIQNNYESYWQVIKDVKNNKASPVILPNAMRNILEHYFNFIHCQNKLSKAFEKLRDTEDDVVFSIFERYVNKESYSDAVNYTDLKEVDVEKFIGYFESVFKQTEFHEHYKKMMGEDSETINDSASLQEPEVKSA